MHPGGADQRWNHNIHYHPRVLRAVPAGARSALDVGTGNGLLAADLHRVLPDVTGIDVNEPVLRSARAEDPGVTWLCGDVLTYDFGRRFDVVASVATLHHLPDPTATLHRFAELTAPGGVLIVVGLARATRPRDHATHLIGAVQHRWLTHRRGYWEHDAPKILSLQHDYRTVRRAAAEALPGAAWKQLPMWRYSITWVRPAS